LEFDTPPTSEWVVGLLDHMKDQKKLHKKYLVILLNQVLQILKKDDSLVHIIVPETKEITVCGDIHG
jgi:serine/threonine-protein phosphatase 5